MNKVTFDVDLEQVTVPTLATVLDRLGALPLAPGLKANLSRDVSRACKWFNKTVADIDAHPARIMALFRRVSAGALNVSKKRFANVRSSLLLALRLTGFGSLSTRLVPLLPEYDHLLGMAIGRYASKPEPSPGYLIGGEVLYGKLTDNSGANGDDIRTQLTFKANFSSNDLIKRK
jgi:hypothetical protein